MKKVKGEMTVFLSLTLMLVASLLFTLAEGARYRCLASFARMDRVLQANSSFAEYDRALMEEYGLLYLDDSYGSGEENLNRVVSRIMNLSRDSLNPDGFLGSTLLRMEMKECSIDAYELAVDYKGDAFRRQIVEFCKENLGAEALSMMKAKLIPKQKAASLPEYGTGLRLMNRKTIQPPTPLLADLDFEFENPLEFMEILQGKAVLALVKPKDRTISTKSAELGNVTDKRRNRSGNYQSHKRTGLDGSAWYLLYLKHNFGNFIHPKENKKLDYEMEYILCGNKSDKKNLEEVCGKIMEIRELLNRAYLETDGEKQGIAITIATILAAVLVNPELIEPFKEAILGAWSYIESLQELKVLLKGGRVPIIKTADTWITDVQFPVRSFEKDVEAEDSGTGLSYEDFLTQFVLMLSEKRQNYRMMSMMELNIRQREGKGSFCMDCMIQRMDLGYVYEARPLFLSMVSIGDPDRGNYRFDEEYKISYLTGDG